MDKQVELAVDGVIGSSWQLDFGRAGKPSATTGKGWSAFIKSRSLEPGDVLTFRVLSKSKMSVKYEGRRLTEQEKDSLPSGDSLLGMQVYKVLAFVLLPVLSDHSTLRFSPKCSPESPFELCPASFLHAVLNLPHPTCHVSLSLYCHTCAQRAPSHHADHLSPTCLCRNSTPLLLPCFLDELSSGTQARTGTWCGMRMMTRRKSVSPSWQTSWLYLKSAHVRHGAGGDPRRRVQGVP